MEGLEEHLGVAAGEGEEAAGHVMAGLGELGGFGGLEPV